MNQNINYYFDDCGVYSGSYPARSEAIAPPDDALWIAPPDECPERSAIVVNPDKSGWLVVPDYRESGAYNPEGQWQRITAPGPLPFGWTAGEPLPSPEKLRLAEIDRALATLDATYLTRRVLANLALGDEFAVAQYEEHERLAEPLRLQKAELLTFIQGE